MKYKPLLIVLLNISLLTYKTGYTQNLNSRRLETCSINILTSGLIGGIGSIIHKKSNQSNIKAFKSGFIKGSLGGFIQFTGKYNSFKVAQGHWGYTYINGALISLGNSITENTALNNPILSNIGFNYGFIRFDISNNTKIRLSPFSLIGFITNISIAKFSLENTIKFNTPTFISNDFFIAGLTLNNNIIIDNQSPLYITAAHELNHAYQYREYSSISNLYFKNNRKYIYWDIPNILPSYIIQSIIGVLSNNYYFNYYEYEAELLSNKFNRFK